MPTESFSPPAVKIGDMVYWYNDPMSCAEPNMGWVCQRPGAQTITVLVFGPYVGFQEKPSVRHRDDPGLQENAEWRQWGCWELAPATQQLRKLEGMMGQIALATEQLALARKQDGGAKNR
ncbi:MAG: hypothetical protein EBR88_00290 [Betaproteobacteria bacterium]|nr:hypothetical protein [Betaproteobacteria bacterium]